MSRVTYCVNGKEVSREEFTEGVPWSVEIPMTSDTYTEHDPLISDGMGCMKSQVPEMREMIRKHGIQGAQVMDNGQIRFTSRRARKEVLERRGLVDADGGYSD